MLNLFKYSKEEIFSKTILNLIDEEDRKYFIKIVENKLNGKKIDIVHKEVHTVTKDGRIVILKVFSSTILYKGRYSGIVLFFDITKEKKIERLYHLSREVNEAITLSKNEEEMFNKICTALVNKVGLKFVWVGIKDKNNIKPLYKYGEDKGYLEKIAISCIDNTKNGKGPVGEAFRKNKIVVISNILTDPTFKPWREAAKEREFLSVASIPLMDDTGKVKYILTMYSKEKEFFDEEIIELLEELKNDLEFSIKRFNEIETNLIISKAVENSYSWVLVTDENFKIIFVNKKVCEISGYSREELIGKTPNIFRSGLVSNKIYEEIYKKIVSGKIFNGILINKKKNGEIFYLKTTIYLIKVDSKVRYISIGEDVTKEVLLEKEIKIIKQYDNLTSLLNREGFLFVLSEELKKLKNSAILALVDVRNFTFINKNFGVKVGNEILKDIANKLKNYFPDAIIARVGADEFAIFIETSNTEETLIKLMDSLNNIFSKPFYINEIEITLSFNTGIATASKNIDLTILFENASLALSSAKADMENSFVVFNNNLEEKLNRINFAKKLIEKAIKENLFVLYYQPLFDTQTLKLVGFEALVRIKDEDKVYFPYFFIDVLEESKYLTDYERWLLNEIKRKATEWLIPISFNISANSFKNKEYIKYLSSLNLNINLVMEITERVLMENIQQTKEILNQVKTITGLKVAMDDFGTEYSSLKYLKDLPVDEIKIDISFTKEIVENEKTRAVVETIITLAKKLGMKTLAEGIETKEQLEILKEMGCNYLQGYLLGKPMPDIEANKLVEKYKSM